MLEPNSEEPGAADEKLKGGGSSCPRRVFDFCLRCFQNENDRKKIYLKDFIDRPLATVNGSVSTPSIPLRRRDIHNISEISIACIENGEICLGLGFIAEVLRYPPAEGRTRWTLSYSVWNDHLSQRLLWRKFFSDIMAFFYVIDACDRKRVHLAVAEINKFVRLPGGFNSFYAIIFLNHAASSSSPKKEDECLAVDELDRILVLDHPGCLGYLIQPIRARKSASLRGGLMWLYSQLKENADPAGGIYPNQILDQDDLKKRRASSKAMHAPLSTFEIDDLVEENESLIEESVESVNTIGENEKAGRDASYGAIKP